MTALAPLTALIAAVAASVPTVAASPAAVPLSAEYTLPFVGPGTYLIFGIVLAPVYAMVAAWFLGDPSDRFAGLLGVGYLAGLTTVLWGSLFVATLIIGAVFF
ncbi:hypothetical protein EXE46_08465 [Halorubrum sp. GN11_10-6_MGM]|uniref:hypothetical protein n=1 Tax=Halorubrum sp. GN11_10-6_MGM TaxID=2518112 RepID=UPI0010F434AB|nr:hypothetical protein [Halorubrum sp. GN11_10-6_MGM]TKX74561.1 hypothetical protein EXE46_08465 [Halorubrum sp. GN11_10-6_MGM]